MSRKQMRKWVRGLIGAAINSAATAITVVVVDPVTFNVMDGGFRELLSAMGISGLVGAGLYLKQHPLPDEDAESVPVDDDEMLGV